MEVIRLNSENIEQCGARTAEVLRAGGVVLYPTDTLYALGADALSDEALAKIYAIKGREGGKPIHALVADLAMAEKYGEVGEKARMLAGKFGGKVTLVVKKRVELNTGIACDISTFGFRIPDNEFCIALVRAFGGPITATSANRAGEKPQLSFLATLARLTETDNHSSILQKAAIALGIDAGELPPSLPSTVVDLSGAGPKVLREGAISATEIMSA